MHTHTRAYICIRFNRDTYTRGFIFPLENLTGSHRPLFLLPRHVEKNATL